MTTNQTIDGVPRELLERIREKLSQTDYTLSNGDPEDELRALLDAPAPRAEFKKIEMAHVMNALEDVRGKPVLTSNQCHDLARGLNDRLLSPLQLLAMPAEYLAAAQSQGEPVAKPRCEQVPFSMLCYGAKFKYTQGESAVFVKIGPDLVAGWDGPKVADGWSGQPVCSFSDDGNLLATVTLVHEQPAPVAVVLPERKSVNTHNSHDWDEGHTDGWKAYDAELKRLNPSL